MYLESLHNVHGVFTSEIIITRTNLAFDDEHAFIDCLGDVLEVHTRVRPALVEFGYREMGKRQKRKRKFIEEDDNPPKEGHTRKGSNCKKNAVKERDENRQSREGIPLVR